MKVLVAESNAINQKLFSKYLSQLGCIHIPVYNGKELLDYLANPFNPRPNIIFMRISMPVMCASETMSILRTQPPFATDPMLRATPVIGCVASPMKGDQERCIRDWCMDDVMVKPVRAAHLKRILLQWSRREFAGGGEFRPVWGPFPLRGYKGPRSLL